ncbi:GATOR complex protein WDR24-like isoform X2 [Eriocheir sinensis]|uniref:GATOR complex protein WDR24-like isoform X2 n=1 Tax=Eriocheir sinensis TaxID=95602 RepID=UPI0021CACC91|nr:GATOR complex protein WDR24-like isoform X2 [Eriocheir sinensis]
MRTVKVTQDVPANALALSPDDTQVVIAGRHVFKIFALEEDGLIERANLRAGKHLNLNFSCNDVVWNPVEDTVLATASTNGAVVTWNLNKASRSKLDCVFNDHSRTVQKVSFHPSEAHLLISGSLDGFMKLFDLRRREATQTYTSNAESVRDLQFNPHNPIHFCAVSESGNVQLWDMRRPDRVEKQFTAHGGPIFALDWHPEVKTWIATAGRDKTIKVWDLNENPTVCNTIQTIASVGRVKWRPNTKYHIASSALLWDCSINVWDICRPYIPLAAFNEHKNLTTGICWRSDPNSLLSVGKDCTLIHHAFQDASRPMEEVNPAALDVSVFGNVSNAVRSKDDSEPMGSLAKLMPIFRSVCGCSQRYARTNFIPVTPLALLQSPPCLFTPQSSSLESLSRTSSGRSQKPYTQSEHNGQVLSSLQLLSPSEDGLISSHHIVHSARQYLLTGRSLAEICEHNAAVAKQLSRHQVALTWQMMQMLYVGATGGSDPTNPTRDDPALPPDTSQDTETRTARHFSGGDGGGDTSGGGGFSAEEVDTETDDTDNHDMKLTNIASGQTINQDFFFGDGEISQIPFDYEHLNNTDTSQDWTLPNEAFEPRHDILTRSAMPPEEFSSKCLSGEVQESGGRESGRGNGVSGYVIEVPSLLNEVRAVRTPAWDCGRLVVEMLYHYASQGDVQMAVTCIIVLGDRLKELLDADHVEHWFLSYIDLLQRFQLWNVANQVIQLAAGLPSVQQLNQQSTVVALQCGRCNQTLRKNSLLCRKCGRVSARCALCHGLVRGLFVWCQGCSHGGHLHHIKEWMATNRACPAGCGHLCEYT